MRDIGKVSETSVAHLDAHLFSSKMWINVEILNRLITGLLRNNNSEIPKSTWIL